MIIVMKISNNNNIKNLIIFFFLYICNYFIINIKKN